MNEIRFKDSQVLSSEKDSSFYLTQQILITDCNGKEHSNDIRQQEHKYLERFGKNLFHPSASSALSLLQTSHDKNNFMFYFITLNQQPTKGGKERKPNEKEEKVFFEYFRSKCCKEGWHCCSQQDLCMEIGKLLLSPR